jgi:hypothetical protein
MSKRKKVDKTKLDKSPWGLMAWGFLIGGPAGLAIGMVATAVRNRMDK